MAIKPILFNTEMVRAILDGRKTQTRRVVKQPPIYGDILHDTKGWYYIDGTRNGHSLIPPFAPGDILWVRETWKQAMCDPAGGGYALTDLYLYKADEAIDTSGMCAEGRWHPSIHMPKEAARIFLMVNDVRVERLQNIDDDGVVSEGLEIGDPFDELWNSTIKKAKLPGYGWEANPWVWVIEFERYEKPEGGGASAGGCKAY